MRAIYFLIGGNVFAQALSFAVMPLVARLFGPENLGMSGMFIALAAILTQISAVSYPLAIVLPKDEGEAAAITSLSLLTAVATSSLVALMLLTSLDALSGALQVESVKQYLWFIPVLMFLSALYAVLDQWANRLSMFGIKAISTSVAAIIVSAAKLTAGFIVPTPFSLIATTSAMPMVQSVSLLSWKRIRSDVRAVPLTDHRKMVEAAWKYRDFALYRAPEQFLNAITQGLPILLFGVLYGPIFTGYLALAIAALNTPANMIGKAIVDVFYPRLSRQADAGESLRPTLIRATAALALLAAPPALILAIYAPSLFTLIFGKDWLSSGLYAQWLSIWTFMMISNRAAMAAIPVLSAQRYLLFYTLVSTPLRAVAIYLAHVSYQDPIMTVIAFSIASAGLNLFLIFAIVGFKTPQLRE